MVVGLGAVLGLNLSGAALFLFSMSFLTLWLVSGSGGLNWLAGIGPIFPPIPRKVFIFFNYCGVGAEPCVPWSILYQLGCTISSENVCPLHGCDLYLYVYYFYRESAFEVAMQKVAFRLK